MKEKIKKIGWKECPQCKGKGEIPLFTSFSTCPECDGSGEVMISIKKIEEPTPIHSDLYDEYGWVMYHSYKIED